ncbi:MAG: pantoate--beta-alanine ligase [Verrucomicrobiae bacterium]|nr:pantoate--beta-alanine ligase [Verrucomicrobiae bacterium]MCP5550540.1 pantoate--beta-alanine ligase [Akkermansiaceae bacterium]
MKLLHTIEEARLWAGDRAARRPRVLVPTMGALHEGHLSLVDLARARAGDSGEVVASIFVNPAQFAPHEDFDRYPRPLESDLALLRARGCDVVFAPARAEMYAPDASVAVVESALGAGLEGASRPRFFTGVCTVVAKLFNLLQPDAAVFGEKDFQQLAVIRRMVRDLDFPVEIIGGPTVREPDGLAMSSRNAYLSTEERAQAASISRALAEAREAIQQGRVEDSTLLGRVRERIESQPLARIDYIAAVDPDTLAPVDRAGDNGILIAVAVFFGKTRLIDNLCWRPGSD